MTVSTEISSNEYTGNGVTTDFDYKFRIFKANQLSVITSDADGDNVVTLRLGTDYTVTGANKSAGGKVILTKPLANGHKISIARDIPITQETSFRNQSKFFAETHENAFDYLTMILQRIWGSLGSLYLKRPNILANWFDAKGYRIANLGKPKRDSDAVDLGTLKDEISGVNSTISKKEKRTLRVDDMDITALPKASDRAGNVLTFDKDGKPIVVAPASGSAADVLNQLAENNGAGLIGTESGETVEESLSKIPILEKKYVNNEIPSSLPSINSSNLKLFIKNTKNDGQSDFYIVSRKADGANGYVAMGVTNVAGAASNVNTGGRSPVRPSETLSLTEVYIGLFTPYSKSWNVDVSGFDRATLQKLYGITGVLGGNLTMSSSLTTNEISFNNPQCYIVKKYGEIVYQVKKGRVSVRLGVTGSSSNNVDISVSTDGVNFTKVKNINLKSSVDSTASYCDIEIDVSLPDGSYIKIKNESSTDTDIIYVIGLNIKKLEECRTDTQYDSAMISSNRRLDDIDNKYQHSSGATEFAAQQVNSKWFGTYHGGHSNFLQRLTLTSNRYSIDNSYDGVPTVELTEIVKLHSISDLTVSGTIYKYISSTTWGQGGHVTDYTIELKQGEPIVCSIAYTNMCTTAPSFKYVHHPVLLENITTKQDITIGQAGLVEQYNAYSVRTLRNYFTQVPMFNNEKGGAFIRFDQYYNKIYYALILDKPSPLIGGSYTSCKIYS
ncbi:TPA: hypothetical protein ACLLFU_001635 [Providencia stuartii]